MKRLCLLLGLVLAATLTGAGPAGAEALSGDIRATLHTHSNPDPNFPGLLFPTDRLSWTVTQGESFSYSSRTCGGNAPFNDIGLDFIPDIPGVDDNPNGKAKVRHRIQGTVTRAAGNRGTISGTITTVLCAGSVETGNVLVSHFTVQYLRISNNALQVWGSFQISPTESTGVFQDMRGGGRMEGRFTCLPHQNNPSQPSCSQLGFFTDFVGHTGDPTLPPGQIQPGLIGRFYDPTVPSGQAAA